MKLFHLTFTVNVTSFRIIDFDHKKDESGYMDYLKMCYITYCIQYYDFFLQILRLQMFYDGK